MTTTPIEALSTVERSRTKARPLLLRLLRRTHMYAGLFLFPWIMVYATAAMLFNHGNWFQGGREERSFREIQLTGPLIPGITSNDELAAAALKALRSTPNAPPAGEAILPDRAFFDLRWMVKIGDSVFNVFYSLRDNRLVVSPQDRRERREDEPKPDTVPPAAVLGSGNEIHALIERAMTAAAAVPGGIPEGRSYQILNEEGRARATLSFASRVGDTTWQYDYDLANGMITGFGQSNRQLTRPRDVITRLHTTHGYPNQKSIRWVWAIFVDAMVGLLFYWAFSGIIMWWQYKNHRIWGAGVIAASLTTAWLIGSAMVRFFARGG